MRGDGRYGFLSYRGGMEPDWEFFEKVSLNEPYYLERARYTFEAREWYYSIEMRIEALKVILGRYTDTWETLTFDQFVALQPLAKVLLRGAEACGVSMGPKDEKEFGERLYEITHRLQTEWGVTKVSSVASQLATKASIRAYLLAAYNVTTDEVDAAMGRAYLGKKYVEDAIKIGSYAYYPGDQIAKNEGWNENPEFSEDEDDDDD